MACEAIVVLPFWSPQCTRQARLRYPPPVSLPAPALPALQPSAGPGQLFSNSESAEPESDSSDDDSDAAASTAPQLDRWRRAQV